MGVSAGRPCVGVVFGSGDCPAMSSVWRELEIEAEFRAWNNRETQSPSRNTT
jgi:hypothetical protein